MQTKMRVRKTLGYEVDEKLPWSKSPRENLHENILRSYSNSVQKEKDQQAQGENTESGDKSGEKPA